MSEVTRLLVDGQPVAPLRVLRGARERARGLLGTDGLTGAIWLAPAAQVHTVGMRYAIDVAFVDRRGVVLRTTTMRPRRLSRLVLASRGVIEAPAGSLQRWGVVPGAVLASG